MRKLCRKSGGKVKFASHERAATRAGQILQLDHSKKELRTYRCKHCGEWHLTSSTTLAY